MVIVGAGDVDSTFVYALAQSGLAEEIYILGEHGDSEFVEWSLAHVAGMSMNDYCLICGGCEDWRTEIEKNT